MWVRAAAEEDYAGPSTAGEPRPLSEKFWGRGPDSDDEGEKEWQLLEGDDEAMLGGVGGRAVAGTSRRLRAARSLRGAGSRRRRGAGRGAAAGRAVDVPRTTARAEQTKCSPEEPTVFAGADRGAAAGRAVDLPTTDRGAAAGRAADGPSGRRGFETRAFAGPRDLRVPRGAALGRARGGAGAPDARRQRRVAARPDPGEVATEIKTGRRGRRARLRGPVVRLCRGRGRGAAGHQGEGPFQRLVVALGLVGRTRRRDVLAAALRAHRRLAPAKRGRLLRDPVGERGQAALVPSSGAETVRLDRRPPRKYPRRGRGGAATFIRGRPPRKDLSAASAE